MFNASHCQEKYNGWQARIVDVKKQIADKKATAEETDKQRKEALANNKHRPRMYKVSTDIPPGECVLI